jgi:hypothetical protein
MEAERATAVVEEPIDAELRNCFLQSELEEFVGSAFRQLFVLLLLTCCFLDRSDSIVIWFFRDKMLGDAIRYF